MKGFCEGAMPGEDYVEVGRDMEESEKAVKEVSISGSGRSPGGGNGNPLQYSWLDHSMYRGT